MSQRPIMIAVAPLGARSLKKDNPAIPLSPKEIASDVIRCAKAGASIAHIHARDETGEPTQSLEVFREICERIREHSDIVLQLSLGTKGFTVDESLEPIVLRPEMASLPLTAFEGTDKAAQSEIFRMARAVRDAGVRPEMAVLNQAMMDGALALVADGAVSSPACFGLFFKEQLPSMQAAAEKLLGLVPMLPADCLWFVAKGYRYTLGIQALAIEMGGHVRVGLEDSLLDFDQSGLAKSNEYFVERSADLIRSLGQRVATPAEARELSAVATPVAG
jgi:3-keto-5-aminohexanoate cleavage enzyme